MPASLALSAYFVAKCAHSTETHTTRTHPPPKSLSSTPAPSPLSVLITFSSQFSILTGGRVVTTAYSLHYQLLNLAGGALAAASAYLTDNKGALPLAVLETIWAAIAICGLWNIARAGGKEAAPRGSAGAAAALPPLAAAA